MRKIYNIYIFYYTVHRTEVSISLLLCTQKKVQRGGEEVFLDQYHKAKLLQEHFFAIVKTVLSLCSDKATVALPFQFIKKQSDIYFFFHTLSRKFDAKNSNYSFDYSRKLSQLLEVLLNCTDLETFDKIMSFVLFRGLCELMR